jgi:uncharacterized membrane protein YkoI
MRLVRSMVRCVIPVAVLGLLLLPARASAQNKKDDEALKALEKVSLKQAVEAAEKESKGTAVAADVRVKGAKVEVIVYVEVNGKSMEVAVDTKTGSAGKPIEPTAKEEKGEHITNAKEIAKQLTDNKQKLAVAIETAEKHSKGKAIAIKPRTEGGPLEFSIHVKANGKWQYVFVDGKTGKVKAGAKQAQKPAPTPGVKSGKAGGQPPAGKGGQAPTGKGGRKP